MPRIELKDLLRPMMTPAQAMCCESFYEQFNIRITNVEPLYFEGTLLGTEFLTYDATKMYLCFDLRILVTTSNLVAPPTLLKYDTLNNLIDTESTCIPYYNGALAAMRYSATQLNRQNTYWSRIDYTDYNAIYFNGYRITII